MLLQKWHQHIVYPLLQAIFESLHQRQEVAKTQILPHRNYKIFDGKTRVGKDANKEKSLTENRSDKVGFL